MAGTGTVSTFNPNFNDLLEIRRALQGIRIQIPIASYNWTGTRPAETDDISKGWKVGSKIITGANPTGDCHQSVFICTDNTLGAAKWQRLATTDPGTTPSAAGDLVGADDKITIWDESAGLNVYGTLNALVEATAGGTSYTVGPSRSTDNAVARYDGMTGKVIQNSAVFISDTGQLSLGIDTPAGNAVLTVSSPSGTQGIQLPTMASTYYVDLPTDGLLVRLPGITEISDGTYWHPVAEIAAGATAQDSPAAGDVLFLRTTGSGLLDNAGNLGGGTFKLSSDFRTVIISETGSALQVTPNAALQVDGRAYSGWHQGILMPRMAEAERDTMLYPAAGLVIYNNTTSRAQVYNGTSWDDMSPAGGTGGMVLMQPNEPVPAPAGTLWYDTEP